MHAMLMHGASAPHVHGDDPIVLVSIIFMLVCAAAMLGAQWWRS